MKSIFLIACFCVTIFTDSLFANGSPDSTLVTKRFFVAKTEFGNFAKDIKANKIDAALNFTAKASGGRFEYVPFAALDSILAVTKKKGDTLTSLTLAEKLKSDFFIFIRINRIENMLRIDMSAINIKDTSKRHYGTGYASLRYRNLTDEKFLYDPAILTATMRAFALVNNDSLMFVVNDSMQVRPLPTLVIGGIAYKDDEKFKSWEVFLHKEISSYDAVENVFEELKDNNDFVIYDIQTRDSVFALYNLLMIENYKGPTANEIKILYQMDVNYYITGSLTRMENGALLDLYLCRIGEKGSLSILGKETGFLNEDSIEEYHKIIRQTIDKLFNKKPWLKK